MRLTCYGRCNIPKAIPAMCAGRNAGRNIMGKLLDMSAKLKYLEPQLARIICSHPRMKYYGGKWWYCADCGARLQPVK